MSAAIPRAGGRSQGFTLLEVMLTLVILAFGMLTLAVMQLHALRQGSQGRHTGDGTAIARSFLEQTSRVPWADLTAAATATGWQVPGWAGAPASTVTVDRPGGAADATEHAYTIRWRVTDVGSTAPICLRDVEVRVQWTEQGSSTLKTHVLGTRRFNAGDPNC
jgi:prepilin-type N-terminal cleavage/methylation domain-containing protein